MDALEIAKIAQIASALEVSGYPKPGNVHRTRDMMIWYLKISS